MQTEFEFTLPRGYVDANGEVYRNGRIRLANALDEVQAVTDPRVQTHEAYLPLILLGRVLTQLGPLTFVTPEIIGSLFASDLIYLQDLYLRLNGSDAIFVGAVCPHCSQQFQLQVAPLG